MSLRGPETRGPKRGLIERGLNVVKVYKDELVYLSLQGCRVPSIQCSWLLGRRGVEPPFPQHGGEVAACWAKIWYS